MQIEYVWINNYKDLLKNLDLNFGGQYNFTYDVKSKCLNIKVNNSFITNFFSKEYKPISNVTAVIGENGVGKTSVIRLVNDILSNDGLHEQYIVVYKHDGKLYGYFNLINKPKVYEDIGIKWIRNRHRNLIQDSGHAIRLIHFSNIFDNSKVLSYNSRLIDICTNKLIKNYRDRDINVDKIEEFDLFTDFKKSETVKKVLLFNFLNKIVDDKNKKFKLLVSLPKEIFIEVNYIVDDCIDMIKSTNRIMILDVKLLQKLMIYIDKLMDQYDDIHKNYELNIRKVFFYSFIQQLLIMLIYDFEFKFERSINYELKYLINELEKYKSESDESFLDIINNFLKYVLIKDNLDEPDENVEFIYDSINEETDVFNNIFDKIEDLKLGLYLYNGEDKEIHEFIQKLINSIIEDTEELENTIDMKQINETSRFEDYTYLFKDTIEEYNNSIDYEFENDKSYRRTYTPTNYSVLLKRYMDFKCEDTDSLMNILVKLQDELQVLRITYYENNVKVPTNLGEDDYVVLVEEHQGIITYINNLIDIIEYMSDIKQNGEIIEGLYEDDIGESALRLKVSFANETLKKFLDKYVNHNFTRDIITFDWYDLSSGQNSYLDMLSRLYMIKYSMRYDNDIKDNIVLIDEGELYLHPNIQSKFLNNLMEFFELIMEENSVQLILTSNSPFIISDLPSENIIYLRGNDELESLYEEKNISKTFGANIHTLLSDTFFMKDGTIGEFSRKKINKVIDLLNKDNKKFKDIIMNGNINLKEIENVINIIGESVVRRKMIKLYCEKAKYIENDYSNNAKKLVEEFSKLNIEEKTEFINEIIRISQKGKSK